MFPVPVVVTISVETIGRSRATSLTSPAFFGPPFVTLVTIPWVARRGKQASIASFERGAGAVAVEVPSIALRAFVSFLPRAVLDGEADLKHRDISEAELVEDPVVADFDFVFLHSFSLDTLVFDYFYNSFWIVTLPWVE